MIWHKTKEAIFLKTSFCWIVSTPRLNERGDRLTCVTNGFGRSLFINMKIDKRKNQWLSSYYNPQNCVFWYFMYIHNIYTLNTIIATAYHKSNISSKMLSLKSWASIDQWTKMQYKKLYTYDTNCTGANLLNINWQQKVIGLRKLVLSRYQVTCTFNETTLVML